jgi:GNAT superfamily N-acetyltransferase
MTSPPASGRHSSQINDHDLDVRELKESNWVFNRDMYLAVGADWKWIDKEPWTEEQWKEYANDPNLRTFAGYYQDKIAGYYELYRYASDVEIAYFGLLAGFVGRGIGGRLLTSAIENAWAWSPNPARVWVHTCNQDHPNALANYQARGFRIYKVEEKV